MNRPLRDASPARLRATAARLARAGGRREELDDGLPPVPVRSRLEWAALEGLSLADFERVAVLAARLEGGGGPCE
jgi:hypothetical protein